MTQAELIAESPVWKLLEDLGPLLDEAFKRENLDAQAAEGLARLKTVQAFTGNRLAGALPDLLVSSEVQQIVSSLTNLTQQVTTFISSGSIQQIVGANGHADNVLMHLSQVIVPLTTNDYVGVKEAADAFRNASQAALAATAAQASQVMVETDALRTRLNDLSAEVTAERQRVTILTSDFQAQFSSAQESRSQTYLSAQTERQERFQAFMVGSAEGLVDETSKWTGQRTQAAREQAEQLAGLKEEFVDSAKGLREELLQHKAAVEKLVGVIGDLGVTSGYIKTAEESRSTVRFWQAAAVLAMLGVIVFAILAFKLTSGAGFSWGTVGGRAFVALAFGVLAGYAAAQADKYQRVERGARKLALELEAIGPFLASLPLEKQVEFKLKIGDRTFGLEDATPERPSPATPLAIIKEIEPLLADLLAKAIKASKG